MPSACRGPTQLLGSGAVDQLQHRRDDLEARLTNHRGPPGCGRPGSVEERANGSRSGRSKHAGWRAPRCSERCDCASGCALVKGVLFYQLTDAFKAREWQERRTLKDLDLALHEAQSRWIRVDRARHNVPTNTGEFAARLAALKSRITELQARLASAEKGQQAYLQQIAVAELSEQKDRLDTYEVQARFALATMYDKASSDESAKPPPGAAK